MTTLINQQLSVFRVQLDELIKELHELTIQINHKELSATVSDLRNRIHDPFMFVIVGEVKSGKSSFVNALLESKREITKVAPQPMTDTIQQILYGEKEEYININPFLKRILVPVEILKEIAIVDTPGTNTIIEHHQEITESFIPASDLIVFVFEAKNPYRQSAWDFFDFIHEDWRKKIIFVLQQKDLLSEDDLQINISGVKEQALKKGIEKAVVFAVSAKQELEGDKTGSGFTAIRAYIHENITGGKAPALKLLNTVDTSRNINTRIFEGLSLRSKQLEADILFRQDIKDTLEDQELKSNKHVDVLVENLIATYDRITREKEKELATGLSFFSLLRRSVVSMFSKKASAKEWLETLAANLEKDMQGELSIKLNDGVIDLADSIQQMAKIIDLKLRNSETILRNDHEIFSAIAERRSNVLRDLQDTFTTFINKAENFTDKSLFPDKQTLSPNLAAGSGLAAIGVILMAVTNGMVFDITGGVLTTIGLIFAGVSTSVKRKKILDGFSTEVQKGRTRINDEVTGNLKVYIGHLKEKIDGNFVKFDELLVKEENVLKELNSKQLDIETKLGEMAEKMTVSY
ncbi:MAG: dynamin family protein [Saprospiraceae bacterium]|nr:dynamin family protein [Saprospiraceae bacterium]MCB9322796.1 dynamin family protein [Lewinellaceae bacterium]